MIPRIFHGLWHGKPKPLRTSAKGEKFDGIKLVFLLPALVSLEASEACSSAYCPTEGMRAGHLEWSLHICAWVEVKWHIWWETTVDGMWTEGRQGHRVIQSSLEHNALAGKVTCSAWESRTADLLPSKDTALSPKHMQTGHKGKAFWGPLSGWVCRWRRSSRAWAFHWFLALEIVSELSDKVAY